MDAKDLNFRLVIRVFSCCLPDKERSFAAQIPVHGLAISDGNGRRNKDAIAIVL